MPAATDSGLLSVGIIQGRAAGGTVSRTDLRTSETERQVSGTGCQVSGGRKQKAVSCWQQALGATRKLEFIGHRAFSPRAVRW